MYHSHFLKKLSYRSVVSDNNELWSIYPIVILGIYLFTCDRKKSFFIIKNNKNKATSLERIVTYVQYLMSLSR